MGDFTFPQVAALSIFVVMIAAMITGRLRFDLVAALALLAGVASGNVPFDNAFSGFSDDVVIIIAGALVVSKAIGRSGIADRLVRRSLVWLKTPGRQVTVLSAIVMVLSAFIKNVGALSMVIPAAYQFARRTGTPPSSLLMPMAFASLLGGVTTLVGTSPNLIVSRIREDMLGEGFRMFDFMPVGLPLAAGGLIVLAVGYRLLPVRNSPDVGSIMADQSYQIEAIVTERSHVAGMPAQRLADLSGGVVTVVSLIRREHSRRSNPAEQLLRPDDHVILQGATADIESVIAEAGLALPKEGGRLDRVVDASDEIEVIEAVVTGESLLVGWSPAQLRLSDRFAVEIVGVQRHGAAAATQLKSFRFATGDVVVLRTGRLQLGEVLSTLNLLPLAPRDIALGRTRHWILPIVTLLVAIVLMSVNLVSVPVAFFGTAVIIVAAGCLTLRDAYDALDPPVLVTLACLIPISESLRTTGVTDLASAWLSSTAAALPPMLALALIMVTAMLVTPFLNNAATVLVAAPVAVSFANNLGYNPDAFLMAVALGAASDFLTPIGHQCNMLVYGPGGYRFSDYQRLGLPLSALVVAGGVPLISWIWPIQ
jgi:di/tricarboxylate transporter